MATAELAVVARRWHPAGGRRPRRTPAGPEGALAVFEQERATLRAVAARIVGSAREAEDVVQEVFIRWQRVDHAAVRNPAAFLTRVATRLAINAVKSAHRRRIRYVGFDVPEPAVDPGARHPLAMQELAEDLTRALGLILERLTPLERAVFLLRECFGYSYAEIAPIVAKSEENCRQIDRRARQHLARERGRPAGRDQREQLMGPFLRAARDGRMEELVDLLARDAADYSMAIKRTRQQTLRHGIRRASDAGAGRGAGARARPVPPDLGTGRRPPEQPQPGRNDDDDTGSGHRA